MTITPDVGQTGGQQYDVSRAIQTIISQMAAIGTSTAAAVIKELLQNADDAGATEVVILLDERTPPTDILSGYRPLLGPGLLIRNNSPFKLKEDVKDDGTDDFTAICDVARGHKRAQATAAGRFGIGFNSVYFLTDTPLLFSRREVHVFDLLHRVFDRNGWRFSLDDFPKKSDSGAGPAKLALQWLFPKAALGQQSFDEIAADEHGDYRQAVVRLPLRATDDGASTLYPDRFREHNERFRVVSEMAEQAAKAIIFLKTVSSIKFQMLSDGDKKPTTLHRIIVSETPQRFKEFLSDVQQCSSDDHSGKKPCCQYKRTITWQQSTANQADEWNFEIRHLADYSNADLRRLRKRLLVNNERAIPWGAIAIPLDAFSARFEGDVPYWRVFLPLCQEGPSRIVASGAFFVDPSRQKSEFQAQGSDEALRKTDWNKALVSHVLVPLLREASADLPSLLPDLISNHPELYISLFPANSVSQKPEQSLAEHFRNEFTKENWILRVFDLWDDTGDPVEWIVGDEDASPVLEMVPERLATYKERFAHLSTGKRRFVKWKLGEAIRRRISEKSQIKIRTKVDTDVIDAILSHETPPQHKDISELLERLAFSKGALSEKDVEGLWALVEIGSSKPLKYDSRSLYLVHSDDQAAQIHDELRKLGLTFDATAWVQRSLGLPHLAPERLHNIRNLMPADSNGALELLSRVTNSSHDTLSDSRLIGPVVDFLISQPAKHLVLSKLKLGFLVITARNKRDRRKFGLSLLRPAQPTALEDAIWECLFRRTLPEVDAECARELHRLLGHSSALIESLADAQCTLRIASTHETLDVLIDAYSQSPDFADEIGRSLNRSSKKDAESRDIKRAVSSVLEQAVSRWHELTDGEQGVILSLPLHSTSDGKYVALIGDGIGNRATLTSRYRVQSDEDIADAPITLPECCLLDSSNPIAKKLYRQLLRIDPHGRLAILKSALRQIGTATADSHGLLRWLGRQFESTLEKLREASDEASREDANELDHLRQHSRSVVCIDETWRSAAECSDAGEIVTRLKSQKWPHQDVRMLLLSLFPNISIAGFDESSSKLIRQLHPELPPVESRLIAERAMTSDSIDLTLEIRLRLLFDNSDESCSRLKLSPAATLKAPTISRQKLLVSESFVVEATERRPSIDLLRILAPETVDLDELVEEIAKQVPHREGDARELKLKLPNLMQLLGAKPLDEAVIREKLRTGFVSVWHTLGSSKEKLLILEAINTYSLAEELRLSCQHLSVILARVGQNGTGSWRTPNNAISPEWVATDPPSVGGSKYSFDPTTSASVTALWNSWCDLNSFYAVLEQCIRHGETLVGTRQRKFANDLYAWLDKVHGLNIVARNDFYRALKGLNWVLASRGDGEAFRSPSEIMEHRGAAILSREFWVTRRDTPLPKFLANDGLKEELGFRTEFEATPDVVIRIAKCLEHTANADKSATIAIYRELVNLVNDPPELKRIWWKAANEHAVIRLFREHSDRVLPISEVFIGNEEFNEDFGEVLFCLGAAVVGTEKSVASLYRKLLVEEAPECKQVVVALSKLEGTFEEGRKAYGLLVDALNSLCVNTNDIPPDVWNNVRIECCAGNFRPIRDCYWDDRFCEPETLAPSSREIMIHVANAKTRTLVELVNRVAPNVVRKLDLVATREPLTKLRLVPNSAVIDEMFEPWMNWLSELRSSDSITYEEACSKGFKIPPSQVDLLATERVEVRFKLEDGKVIESSPEWLGPVAFRDGTNRVVVRADQLSEGIFVDARKMEALDEELRAEFVDLLVPNLKNESLRQAAIEFMRDWVERPLVVLEKVRKENERQILEQYSDQAADSEFAIRYEAYRRTKAGSPRHEDLSRQLLDIVSDKFVAMRRNQIRQYGYDESSVFAELIQNAEDAYASREQLDLADPPECSVSFRYEIIGDQLTLFVEHYGRPFNCWRNGDKSVVEFRRDVEGVLRSSGSFKPHSVSGDDSIRPIGQFGLGFKSVYLISNQPSIFSGGWHFRIENGRLPKAVERPHDLTPGATRLCLPLLEDSCELKSNIDRQCICLLPFLTKVDELRVTNSDQSQIVVKRATAILVDSTSDGRLAELVTLTTESDGKQRQVQFIRIRHGHHDGQLAILLASDGLPRIWSDIVYRPRKDGSHSASDFYSALPLKSELGCGLAVSHRFSVQSGRTHLVDSVQNETRAEELADLLVCVSDLLSVIGQEHGVSDWLLGFWNLWRWETGDAETRLIRQRCAQRLLKMSSECLIVPTRDSNTSVALGGQLLFNAKDIPISVIDILIASGFRIFLNGEELSRLAHSQIVAPGFVRQFIQLCNFVKHDITGSWIDISWDLIGDTCVATPWLADFPAILNAIAATGAWRDSNSILEWLPNCYVRATDGNQQSLKISEARDLLIPSSDLRSPFPMRYLRFVDTSSYSDDTIEMLVDARLRKSPHPKQMLEVIQSTDLTTVEARGVLDYLQRSKRWRDYDDIQHEFQSKWFPTETGLITLSEAVSRKLFREHEVEDDEFRAWLGIKVDVSPPLPKPPVSKPTLAPKEILLKLHQWWEKNGAAWTRKYESRIYLHGAAAKLLVEPDLSDLPQRRDWVCLFLLGACHTIGRTKPEQHKEFLALCRQRNWLDVFAQQDASAHAWIQLLEEYLDHERGGHRYYQWVKLFVPIFHVSRWLESYVRQFTTIDRRDSPFTLLQLTSPREDGASRGGGSHAPSISRPLGMGACFVIREVCRRNLVTSAFAHRHCFVPNGRIRQLVQQFLTPNDYGDALFQSKTSCEWSVDIYKVICDQIGSELATFNRGFDLPLIALCEDQDLQRDLLKTIVTWETDDDFPERPFGLPLR